MNPFIRFDVDLEALTDAMWEFVTDPRPSRNERPVVKALDDIHPESVEVLESMLLDGTEEREDVAAYVDCGLSAMRDVRVEIRDS